MGTLYATGRIVVLVPAHNEAESIAATLHALLGQTRPPDRIIVVPNNCTDDTAVVAAAVDGVEVLAYPGYNPHRKAGALNWAINRLLPTLGACDRLLVTDADSVLAPEFVATAVRALDRGRRVGAVCASFYGDHKPGLLSLLQRNEYSRFARQVSRKRERAQVLSGVASMFRVSTIRRVCAERAAGRLPGRGDEFYHVGTATEDIELTFAVRELGYRPLAPDACRATTDTMPTLSKLYEQRVRWQRGMLDSIRLYGLNPTTLPAVLRVATMYAASLTVPLYLVFLALAMYHYGTVPYDWRWTPLLAVFALERTMTVRRDGFRSVLAALLLAPEWCYEQLRSLAYWAALWRTLRGTERTWFAT